MLLIFLYLQFFVSVVVLVLPRHQSYGDNFLCAAPALKTLESFSVLVMILIKFFVFSWYFEVFSFLSMFLLLFQEKRAGERGAVRGGCPIRWRPAHNKPNNMLFACSVVYFYDTKTIYLLCGVVASPAPSGSLAVLLLLDKKPYPWEETKTWTCLDNMFRGIYHFMYGYSMRFSDVIFQREIFINTFLNVCHLIWDIFS